MPRRRGAGQILGAPRADWHRTRDRVVRFVLGVGVIAPFGSRERIDGVRHMVESECLGAHDRTADNSPMTPATRSQVVVDAGNGEAGALAKLHLVDAAGLHDRCERGGEEMRTG